MGELRRAMIEYQGKTFFQSRFRLEETLWIFSMGVLGDDDPLGLVAERERRADALEEEDGEEEEEEENLVEGPLRVRRVGKKKAEKFRKKRRGGNTTRYGSWECREMFIWVECWWILCEIL